MTAFPSYSVGTVSVKKGDAVIVGAGGTIWTSTVNVQSGDDIIIAGHIWPISDVTDANHLAIDLWPFDDVPAGTPYKILQRSPLRFSGATAAANVMRLVNAIDTEGVFRIVQAGAAAPDPSLGEENQFALQPSTFKLWLKTGGAWVFQGIFKGFNIRGAWDAKIAYDVNDVVSQDGSSYVAIAPSTNQPPTNAAFWSLLAAKGDPGAQGAQGTPGSDGTNGIDGPGYAATSTTSLTIGKGQQTFATQAGLAYSAGARARASSGANYMEGQVTAYDGGNLTINVDRTVGSGTFANWNINLAGDPGAGNGDMLAANNLSDVGNKEVALANLRGVIFGAAQGLTQAQQAQALGNIGAAFAGLINKFRNGTLDVWQRGPAVTAIVGGSYTADGWIVAPTGANVVASKGSPRLLTSGSLLITGASGVTDVAARQRIEGAIAAPLSAQIVTVQAQVFNNTGAAITPTLTVRHANAADNWSAATTDVNAVNLQQCPNGVWTLVSFTFVASASAASGLEVTFDFGNNFSANTKTVAIAELDIRATPGLPLGLNSNPPEPELRPIASELDFCGRYLQTTYGNNVAVGTATAAGISFVGSNISGSFIHPAQINFRVPFRAVPALINFWDAAGNPGKLSFSGNTGGQQSSGNNNGTSITGFAVNVGPNGFTATTGMSSITSANYAHWAFQAEL